MKSKYIGKKLVFLLDNLWAHKCTFIIKIAHSEDRVKLLYTPSNTPSYGKYTSFSNYSFQYSE